jgi:hypothetical protein
MTMDGTHDRDLNALAQFSRQALDVTWTKTGRGFRQGVFRDRYGQECSIQESSLAGEYAIWFGVDLCRMHLTYEQVRALHHILTDFLADSNFRAQFDDERVDPEAEEEDEQDAK